jgi:hypothetical protein
MANKPLHSITFPDLPDTYTIPQVTTDLTQANKAAEAKKVGDELDELKSAIEQGAGGLTDDAKQALMTVLRMAVYNEDPDDALDALENELYNTTWSITNTLSHCTTSNAAQSVTKGGAYSATITASAGYVMTGATVGITMGGVDITATAYSNGVISIPAVTGALVITISAAAKTVSSITAVYTPSGTVYDTDTLDSLKDDLVVTATYDDTSTEVIPAADYTLSGSMSHGTQTITVTFSGATTTFTVTISEHWSYGISDLNKVTGAFTTEASATCGVAMKLSETNRRSFYLTHGVTSVAKMQSGSIISQTSEYYPVKVPEGATGISVSITPSTQYVGATLRSLTDGVYTNVEQPGYKQGTSTFTITGGAPDNYWIMITTKHNSGGTSYPTQPTALDVVFTS